MPSAPSRFEVEHLHRLMLQASVDAAAVDGRLDQARKADSLWPILRAWHEAAGALDAAVLRAQPFLELDGTPREQIDRLRDRLASLEERCKHFDLDFDLDGCVEWWQAVGLELPQLSGVHRDPLVRMLQQRKPAIDRATALLTEARQHEGLPLEQHRRVVELTRERDHARAKYERLRQAYLIAEQDFQAAQRQAHVEAPAQQHGVEKAPLPDLQLPKPRTAPVVVHLPDAKAAVVPKPAQPAPRRVALERLERVGGYPTGQDGIGRGRQTAAIWFRADALDHDAVAQGTTTIQLGSGARLDVMPSVQLFAAVPEQPLRGKLALLLIAGGGALGAGDAKSARAAAKLAGSAGGRQVAAKLGALGAALQAAIVELVEDAAEKVFSRAQAMPRAQEVRSHHAAPAEHHVARFDAALGAVIHEARAVRGAFADKQKLRALLDRDHHQRDAVAGRLEKTLSHLATATHRTLTDPHAGELRSHLARMDTILAGLRGKAGEELLDGARSVSAILGDMNAIAARAGGAPYLAEFRRLIDERKGQLHRIAQDAGRKPRPVLAPPPRPSDLHGQLRELRRNNPGLDRLLRSASQAQLAAELAKARTGLPGLGTASLTGGFHALAPGHRSGLGALSGDGGGALGKALGAELERKLRHAPAPESALILAGLHRAQGGSPLREVARRAEERQRQRAVRVAGRRGPPPGQTSGAALLDVLREHPKGAAVAQHFAPGGALRSLCETAQRGHGLPIGQAAQHYLASRGSDRLWNAVTTFNTLVKEGHRPRFSFGSWLKKTVSDHVSSATHALSKTVSSVTHAASSFAGAARSGLSDLGHRAVDFGRNVVNRGVNSVTGAAHRLYRATSHAAQSAWGGIQHGAHALAHVVTSGAHSAAGWAQHKVGAAAHWADEKVHAGLDWARRTGVAGAVGTGLRKGLSFVKRAAESTPLGYAVKKGYGFVKSGGLTKVWDATKHAAGAAFGGLKSAYAATSKFVQSPIGQLLVTGLSLAASFIPGGIVVKAAIGAGIGALQAMSEGKDWKAVLASAAGGAITGAIPFMKLGPLAKVGVGALQGGIATLASGGSLKEAVKGAAGGALDAFDPGAFHALKRMKGFTAAEKLLKGKNLSRAEKEFLATSKAAGPLRALEKVMENPRTRRTVGALEKATSKAVKGGIWVSGKAAKAQHALDRAVALGDRVHGALWQVHALAPELAGVLGDSAAGHFVSRMGDWAGKGDGRLQRALDYGHGASDRLSTYRGYLDKGLGYAGVRDPAKAYEKMMARKDLRADRKGALERVAQLKLEDHRRKHPELHLAEATGKRTREAPAARRAREPRSRLEQALARGKRIARQGQQVAQGVHHGLGKVHDVVGKGVSAADKVQAGLEKASGVAKQAAGILGPDTDLGKHLLSLADRADHIHEHVELGLDAVKDFNAKVGKVHDAFGQVPGVHDRVHLEGGKTEQPAPAKQKSPHEAAWVKIGSVSRQVQQFETRNAQTQRKVQELLAHGKANQAATELMGAGSHCAEVGRAIAEAKALAKGNEKYEKEIDFYESWHKETSARLHAAIADTKGLGGEVAISGFGISETTHADIYANTRAIYAVRAPRPTAPANKLDVTKTVQHGLEAIQAYRKKAIRTGRKIDAGLSKVETGLDKGLRAGKKVDSGLEKLAGVAEQISGILGEESSLGHLAHQIGQSAGKGHDKLHEALHLAGKGKGALHKGHEIFHHAMQIARGHHAQKLEKAHGKSPHGGFGEALSEGWNFVAGLFGQGVGAPAPQADPHQLVEEALTWVAELGKAITQSIQQIETLMHAGKLKEATARVEVVRQLADKTREACARALEGAKDRAMRRQAETARKHYLELRGQFFKFVSGIHGLAGDAQQDAGAAPQPSHAPAAPRKKRARSTDELIADILNGSEGRVHVDRGAARGDAEAQDEQEVDSAAVDTWTGSGAGVELFSQVFGTFLPAEGAIVAHHGRREKQAGGFFSGLFDRLEGFSDHVARRAHEGRRLLGKGMHYAGLGMHALKSVRSAAGKVRGDAKTAGKQIAEQVEEGAHEASGIFDPAAHGRLGELVSLFRSPASGDGLDGRIAPEKVALGSVFDEPRRLDVSTLSRMEAFLGGSFAGVRIHTGPGAAEVTRRFNAEAVTVKDHIFFAPGRFNPSSTEGQKLIAHELTHVLQKGRPNLDVRTAEGEALHSEHTYGRSPSMETLSLRPAEPDFRLAPPDGEGAGAPNGIHTAKRTRSRGHEVGGKDALPDGEEFLDLVSGRVYELLMQELEQAFESR